MSRVITLGEVLMRMTAPDQVRMKEADRLNLSVGGAEANVAVSLASYGNDVSLVTALPTNDLGENVTKFLKSQSVLTEFISYNDGRLGLYFVEEGLGVRQPSVTYDRKFSAFTQMDWEALDWEAVFKEAELFHVSGITPALGDNAQALTFKALQEAADRDIPISFDCNYRSKLWQAAEAKACFEEIFEYVDICFAGYKDFVYLFGMEGSDVFDENLLKDFYRIFAEKHRITTFACTNRMIHDAKHHSLQGFLYQNEQLYQTAALSFEVLDRIGGGDSFAAGILHGLLKGQSPLHVLNFGLAAGILKHTVAGDHNQFNEQEIIEWLSNKDIKDVAR